MRELVISRYNEQLDWVNALLPHFDRVTVYNKGSMMVGLDRKINEVARPNVGREGETYLYHIISRYDSLADETVFCQGNPIEHNEKFVADARVPNFDEFKSLSKHYKPGRPKKPLDSAGSYEINSRTLQLLDPNELDLGVKKFTGIASTDIVRNGEDLNDRSLAEYVCDRCGVPRPTDPKLCFTYSAQFSVRKDLILSHPISVYECLVKWLLEIKDYGGSQGYVLERLWQHILRSKSERSAVCMVRQNAPNGSADTTLMRLNRFHERSFQINCGH